MPVLPPLAKPTDVADVWRALTSDEVDRALNLIGKASALLRHACPWVDARLAAYVVDPTDPTGLSPEIVATVVATVVKRFLSNAFGVASEGMGGYSIAYSLRSDKGIRGELAFLESDIERLAPASLVGVARLSTIKVAAAMAPTADDSTLVAALDVFVPGDPNGNWFQQGGV